MAQRHPSTPAQRAEWISRLLAPQREYGLVTLVSQEARAARQTLYRWEAQGRRALEAAFAPVRPAPEVAVDRAGQVLTLLVETHASERGIQAALSAVSGESIGLETISAIIGEAERRARAWLASQAPPGARPLALDEDLRQGPPGGLPARGGCRQLRGLGGRGPAGGRRRDLDPGAVGGPGARPRWEATSSAGGAALAAALRVVDPDGQHGRDPWHVLHVGSQVQGRLDRWVATLDSQTATVARQAARVAAGQRPRGHNPRTDPGVHAAVVAQARAWRTGRGTC